MTRQAASVFREAFGECLSTILGPADILRYVIAMKAILIYNSKSDAVIHS